MYRYTTLRNMKIKNATNFSGVLHLYCNGHFEQLIYLSVYLSSRWTAVVVSWQHYCQMLYMMTLVKLFVP